MVVKVPDWFVYEPGDEVYSLQRQRTGLVMSIASLNIPERSQQLNVLFRGEETTQQVDGGTLELKRPTAVPYFNTPVTDEIEQQSAE